MTRQFRVALLVAFFAGTASGQSPSPSAPKPNAEKLSATLRDVINKGVDLYNPPTRDHAGCYRLYQGALLTVRVQLEAYPELQRNIDIVLADAERVSPDGQRAYALRQMLDQIRSTIAPKNPKDKPVFDDEKKVEPKKQQTTIDSKESMKVTVNGKPVSAEEVAAIRGFLEVTISKAFANAVNQAWRELQWLPVPLH